MTSLALPALRRRVPALAGALLLLPLLAAWEASGLDLPLAHLAGGVHGFPWREHWLLAGVLHQGGRLAAWLGALALCLLAWWPLGPWRRLSRAARIRLAASTLLAPLAVTLVKAASPASCPWDLHEFGGVARYVSHWRLLADGGSGHCFPAGHAAGGFAFLGGWFAFRDVDTRLALAWALGAVALGLLFGVAQQLRGAHFMSHTLWTAWVCWVTHALVHAAPVPGLQEAP